MFNIFKKKNSDNRVSDEILSAYEFYKAAFELAQDAKLVLDGARIIKFNTKAYELLNFDSKDLDFCRYVDVNDDCVCRALATTKTPTKCTVDMVSSAGRVFKADAVFTPLYIGGKLLMFVTVRDISELVKAQDETRMFVSALNEATHGIAITNEKGEFVWANKAVFAMTGYSLGELLGQNPRILKSGLMNDSVYKELWNTILSGQIWKGELINKRKDSTTYVDYTTIIPVSRNGKIANFIVIKEDYTLRYPEAHNDEIENLEYLTKVFENSDAGYALLSFTEESYVTEYINKKGMELTHLTEIPTPKNHLYAGECEVIYKDVLLTGKPTKFIMAVHGLEGKFEFYAFRPTKNRVAVLFKKI
jgi:PAS domain S-box-containing protein